VMGLASPNIEPGRRMCHRLVGLLRCALSFEWQSEKLREVAETPNLGLVLRLLPSLSKVAERKASRGSRNAKSRSCFEVVSLSLKVAERKVSR
jgi:hypothetical protein